ncbi:Wzz/FepE/Etk N-terminal domain-containing protein [uncultured Microbulbifer sp.]|uniref:LPS O-antigen chain length determinant protein WzzB n=1 Tax=uncultured Microbulbifer sp. TaxID=348147 RepID=UPI0026071578|nr:Wzz/FepE/Etk N-terminal domain-containing protein [uncultured Microbulbifer sp.]
MIQTNYPGRAPEDDEIDLVALVQGLWAQKWLIASVTLVITLGSALYVFLSKPVYEARIAVLPPALRDIAGFNVARSEKSGLLPFTVDEVFAEFTGNLQSEESRRQFFRDVYLPSLDNEQRLKSQGVLYKEFQENVLRILEPTKSQSAYIIAVEHIDPVQAAEWVNLYLDQVTRQSLIDVVNNTQREMEVRSRQFQQELKIMREFAKIRKKDQLVKLREALTVAEAVGLVGPHMTVGLASPTVVVELPSPEGSSSRIAQQASAFRKNDLMYLRGTKALLAEIEALESRTSEDPFIPSLRSLEEQYSFLNNIHFPPKNLAIARPDGIVETPDAPIKPRKVLVLALGAFLGSLLGIFIALIRLMFCKHSATAQAIPASVSQPMGAN